MACYYPIQAWRSDRVNEQGKRPLVFKRKYGQPFTEMKVACGVCVGCRLDYSREWAIRCVHEASLHPANSFITLTYNKENLPKNASLDKRDFQLFMKKLRRKISPQKVRYYMCGEYGEKNGRPHYHAILFGYQFPDLKLWKVQGGNKYYLSQMLSDIWGKGHVVIGEVTFDSAAYVARYTMKKVRGKALDEVNEKTGLKPYQRINENGEIVEIEPEYSNPSRNPGIASEWFKKYSGDLYPKDFITYKGQKFKPPAYYDKLMEEMDEDLMEVIKSQRKKAAEERKSEQQRERLVAREKVTTAKLNLKSRSI